VGASGDINIPADIGLTFGDDGEKIEGDGTDLTIAGNNINLTAAADVVIPADVGITFATAEKIESDGTDLTITVGAGGDINIGSNIGLTFGDDGEKIEGDGSKLVISAANLDLTVAAGGAVTLPNNVGLIFGDSGEKIEGDGTNLTIASSNDLTLDAAGDINIDADSGITYFKDNGTTGFRTDVVNRNFRIYSAASGGDYLQISTTTDGASTISTFDEVGSSADLTLSADGNIILAPSTPSVAGGGQVSISGTLAVSGTIIADSYQVVEYTEMYSTGSTNFGDSSGDRHIFTGNMGIGVSDPDSPLEVLSTSTQQKWSYDANSFATMTVADASHATIATGESGNLILSPAGNVGIGTTSPNTLLDVDGDARFNKAGADKDFLVATPLAPAMLYVDGGSNRVGVGLLSVRSPDAALEVVGAGDASETMRLKHTGQVYGSTNPFLNLNYANASTLTIYTDSANHFVFKANHESIHLDTISGKNLLLEESGGKVGIGITAPTSTLDLSGSMSVDFNNQSKTAGQTYVVVATDYVVNIKGTGARAVTLQAADTAGQGRILVIKDGDGTGNAGNITINRSDSDTIDGAASVTITSNYGSVSLVSDGASKWIVY
jgi:hypothetical protein